MTIAATTVRSTALTDGSTGPYSFGFLIYAESDLVVYREGALLTLDVDYTVSGGPWPTGGTITLTVAGDSGDTLAMYSAIPQTQETDFATSDSFPSASHENSLDKLTRLVHQLQDQVHHALRSSLSESPGVSEMQLPTPVSRRGKYLTFADTDAALPEVAELADASLVTLSQSVIGGLLYPQTAAESAAGETPVNYQYHPRLEPLERFAADATGTTDAAAALQSSLNVGGYQRWSAGLYRCESQLVIKAGTHLEMDPNCVILRAWAQATGGQSASAQFKNENAPTEAQLNVDPGPWTPSTTDDDIYIEGGRIRPLNSSMVGTAYNMVGCDNLRMVNTVVERTYENWAFAIGGDNVSIIKPRVEENSAVFEDGIHIIYGDGGMIDAEYIHSGDDCFAFGSEKNLPISNWDIRMGNFYSQRGFAIKVLSNREGNTAGFGTPDQKIKNIHFHDGEGKAGVFRNGQMWCFAADGSSPVTNPLDGILENISISDVTVDSLDETHDGANDEFAMWFQNVNGITLTNVRSRNPRGDVFYFEDCTKAVLINGDAPDTRHPSAPTSYIALRVDDTDLKVIGGEFERTVTHVCTLTGVSSLKMNGAVLKGINDNFYGINIGSNCTDIYVGGTEFRKASGETTSGGITTAACDRLIVDSAIWNVDLPIGISGAPTYMRTNDVETTRTIATGTAVVYGANDLSLLCEGGTADTISSLTGAYKGQVVTLTNAEADPATDTITVQANTGANQFDIGTDYVMDHADCFITLRYDGTNWEQIARGD